MRSLMLLCTVVSSLATLPLTAQDPGPRQGAPLPSITLPPALDRVLRDYERAWQAGDETTLASLFTADGFVPAGHGWVRGTDAIRARYANSGGHLRLRAHAFATADSVGYIVGAYGYGDEDGAPDRGKFLLALRRSGDGTWLIAADLDNSNL